MIIFKLDDKYIDDILTLQNSHDKTADWSKSSMLQDLISVNSIILGAKSQQGELTGFIFAKILSDRAEILNLAVSKASLRCGTGHKLVKEALNILKNKKITDISLEVNEHNVIAQNLYKKVGFELVGIRKKFYNNKDNAFIMRKK